MAKTKVTATRRLKNQITTLSASIEYWKERTKKLEDKDVKREEVIEQIILVVQKFGVAHVGFGSHNISELPLYIYSLLQEQNTRNNLLVNEQGFLRDLVRQSLVGEKVKNPFGGNGSVNSANTTGKM